MRQRIYFVPVRDGAQRGGLRLYEPTGPDQYIDGRFSQKVVLPGEEFTSHGRVCCRPVV